jgi:Leucine-rich repeat (LRR) protein
MDAGVDAAAMLMHRLSLQSQRRARRRRQRRRYPRARACPSVLSRLTDLRQLGVERTVVGDGILIAIASLPSLETLNLAYTKVTDIALARAVRNMTQLRWLSLEETAVTDFSLERIAAGASKLRHLDLSDTAVTALGISALHFLPDLRSLNIGFCPQVNGKGLNLGSLHALEALTLDGEQKIGDEGLADIASLRNLRELDLYSALITDDGLTELAHSPVADTLVSLDLSSCVSITDASVKHLARMRNLHTLNLSQTGIADIGACALLSSLPHLSHLNLNHTDVTDATLSAARAHPTLRRLSIQGCHLIANPPEPITSVAPAAAHARVLRIGV